MNPGFDEQVSENISNWYKLFQFHFPSVTNDATIRTNLNF